MMLREYFKVRRLARQLGMSRPMVRMMLAIESGRIDGDVCEVGDRPHGQTPAREPSIVLDRVPLASGGDGELP